MAGGGFNPFRVGKQGVDVDPGWRVPRDPGLMDCQPDRLAGDGQMPAMILLK